MGCSFSVFVLLLANDENTLTKSDLLRMLQDHPLLPHVLVEARLLVLLLPQPRSGLEQRGEARLARRLLLQPLDLGGRVVVDGGWNVTGGERRNVGRAARRRPTPDPNPISGSAWPSLELTLIRSCWRSSSRVVISVLISWGLVGCARRASTCLCTSLNCGVRVGGVVGGWVVRGQSLQRGHAAGRTRSVAVL